MTDELYAICTRQQAGQLVNYDHLHIHINGRLGIMLTYHWMPIEDAAEPLLLKVVLHDSARQHPPAPPDVYDVIASLQFSPDLIHKNGS
jgi:hypothetical protein